MDDAAKRRALVQQFEDGRDLDANHEIYHDDAVLEFPQSGERFVGRATFLTWRKRYPAKVDYRIRRMMGGGELWVIELLVSYDGGPPMFGIAIEEFRGDRIAREVIYVSQGFDAAEVRRPWVTRFDPLASISPADWEDGVAFGLDAAGGA